MGFTEGSDLFDHCLIIVCWLVLLTKLDSEDARFSDPFSQNVN